MDAFFLLFLPLLAIILIIGIPVALSIYGYRKVRKTKFKKYAFLIPSLIIGFFAFEIYVAIFPLDSFYRDDFKTITGFDLNDNAKILRKDASFPDNHGAYCSSALIQIDNKEYKNLLDKIKSDKSFNGTTEIGSDQYDYVTKREPVEYAYKISKTENGDDYKFIGFLKDEKTIIIHLCK